MLIDMMEKLGSDASLAPLDDEKISQLEAEINSTEFPEIKCLLVVPAEDDEDSQEDNQEGETENSLNCAVNL
tara:strand:- start:845 stop:1060 length:216 start_codon:yes stop_codon:yes gene_type:complete